MSDRSAGHDSPAIHLLIVEKHSSIRAGLCALIEAWGWRDIMVETADGFAGASQSLAAQWPSLVLLDMELPDNASSSLLQRIKAHQPSTPVIAWMLYSTNRIAALEAGADICLDKGAPAWALKQAIIDLVLTEALSAETEEC